LILKAKLHLMLAELMGYDNFCKGNIPGTSLLKIPFIIMRLLRLRLAMTGTRT
jgi:hypothetical protein